MNVTLDGIFKQNVTYDYDYEYENEDISAEKGSEAVWIPVLFSLVLLVGLLGNLLVLVALAQRRQLWSMSDTFILHLVVADILLLVMLPFWAAQTAEPCGWCCGIFCKIRVAVFNINFNCGILLLVCITLDHYLSTNRGVHLFSLKVPSLAHACCFAVWVVSLILTIPDWIFVGRNQGPARITHCVHIFTESDFDWHLISRLIHHICCFLIPTVILIVSWSCILLRHSCTGILRQRRIMLILPLVVVFLLSWMPYNIILFVDTFHNRAKGLHNKSSGNPEGSMTAALTATSTLACMHACLRPLLYLVLSRNFRKQTWSLLRRTAFESKGSLWELGVGEEVPHDRDQSVDELKRMTCGEDHDQSVQS